MVFNCHCENTPCNIRNVTVARYGWTDTHPGGTSLGRVFLEHPLCSECGHELTVRGKA